MNDVVGNPLESLEIFESNKVKRQGNTRYYLMPVRLTESPIDFNQMNESKNSTLN